MRQYSWIRENVEDFAVILMICVNAYSNSLNSSGEVGRFKELEECCEERLKHLDPEK